MIFQKSLCLESRNLQHHMAPRRYYSPPLNTKEQLRIAIIGSGTAGCTAAILLHRQNHFVEVFEQVLDPKPSVGAGFLLQPSGMCVLNQLGMLPNLLKKSTKIHRLWGETRNHTTVLDLRYSDLHPSFFGLGTDRSVLFRMFYEELKDKGIILKTGQKVVKIQKSSGVAGRSQLSLENGTKVPGEFDLVIIASGALNAIPVCEGAHSITRKFFPYPFGVAWAIFTPTANEFAHLIDKGLLYNQYKGCRYMLGLMPTGEKKITFFWSTPVAEFDKVKAMAIPEFLDHLKQVTPNSEPVFVNLTNMNQLYFTKYGDARMNKWHTCPLEGDSCNIVFLGDTAHACSPQLGQGANLALIDAAVLATCLSDVQSSHLSDGVAKALQAYSAKRKRHLLYHQRASSALTPLFQSDTYLWGVARDLAMWKAHYVPYVYKQSLLSLNGFKTGVLSSYSLQEAKTLFDSLAHQ